MRIWLEAVDGRFMLFFKKITYWFAWLTGKNNFFLAKAMFGVVMVDTMIEVGNYWVPVLARKTTPADILIDGILMFFTFRMYNSCDSEEKRISSAERVKSPFALAYNLPIFRPCVAIYTLLSLSSALSLTFRSSDGIMFFKIMYNTMNPALVAFLYFVVLDPPQVGKSKVREWQEGFSAAFRKLSPIPAKE